MGLSLETIGEKLFFEHPVTRVSLIPKKVKEKRLKTLEAKYAKFTTKDYSILVISSKQALNLTQWGRGYHKIFFIFVIWWFQRIVLVKIRLQNDFLSVLNDKKGLKKTRKVWDSNPQPQFHWKLLHKNKIFKVNFLIEHAGAREQ